MKRLLLILLLSGVSFLSNAQDGIARWIDTDSVDTFISIYNSPIDTRVELGEIWYMYITQRGEPKAGNYMFVANGATVQGEMFIRKAATYILYDFYVDAVRYADGMTYRATRFEKPKGPYNY